MFVTWEAGDERGRAVAMHQASKAMHVVEPIIRSRGSDIYQGVGPGGTSIRDGFTRSDYEQYRPDEMRPRRPKDVVLQSMIAYNEHGLVRNVIDLMGDFATQGINLYHPNERVQKWFQEWFKKVNGKERSERFMNLLYRCGSVIIRRQNAKITVKVEKAMKRAQAQEGHQAQADMPGVPPSVQAPADVGADPDTDILDPLADEYDIQKRTIPWRYTYLNPMTVQVLGDDLASFVGIDAFTYAVEIPMPLAAKIKSPKKHELPLVERIPQDIRDLIRNGERLIPLDPNKIAAFYYKRDDWQLWPVPLVGPILKDLALLEKMKLADLAALDGAVSCIRVWKLGNIEARILPTEYAINRLAEMLMQNVGGGVMDLVWGPELELTETSTLVHKFLGQTKYEPVLNSIYQGLGVPPSLTGSAGGGQGFTNNFISLKTLTERLEYGRDVLRAFWDQEIRIVQKAMGFRFPATVVYDRMVLTDEAAEKQLLLNLADRDLISWESLVERFGEDPDIEEARIRRETRKRAAGQMPPKASPFHDPQEIYGLKKIFSQQGVLTPSQVGVELEDKASGEKSLLDQQGDQTIKQSKLQNQAQDSQNDHQFRTEKLQLKHGVHPAQLQQQAQKAGQPGQGRPKGSKDSGQRKQKQVKTRTSAAILETTAWAETAQASVLKVLAPAYLSAAGKQTLRELTDEETRNFEELKFRVLCQFQVREVVDKDSVLKAVSGTLEVPDLVMRLLKATVTRHAEQSGKEPPLETLRRYQAGVYALYRGEYDDEEAGDSSDGLPQVPRADESD